MPHTTKQKEKSVNAPLQQAQQENILQQNIQQQVQQDNQNQQQQRQGEDVRELVGQVLRENEMNMQLIEGMQQQQSQVNQQIVSTFDVASKRATGLGMRLKRTKVPAFAKGIEAAAKFFAKDKDSKSPLFLDAEKKVMIFLDRLKSVENLNDETSYMGDYILAKEAVQKYYNKNSGIKISRKGRRRRGNMEVLLTALTNLGKTQVEGDTLNHALLSQMDDMQASTIEALSPLFGEDCEQCLEQENAEMQEAFQKAGAQIQADGAVAFKLEQMDLQKADAIFENGTIKEKYAMYLFLSDCIGQCNVALDVYRRQTKNKEKTYSKKVESLRDAFDKYLTYFQSEEVLRQNTKELMRTQMALSIHVIRQLHSLFVSELEKMNVTLENATKTQKKIALANIGNHPYGRMKSNCDSTQGTLLGTDYATQFILATPITQGNVNYKNTVKEMQPLLSMNFAETSMDSIRDLEDVNAQRAVEQDSLYRYACLNDVLSKGYID